MVINACATAAKDILHDCMHAHPKQKPKTTQAFTHMLVSQALICNKVLQQRTGTPHQSCPLMHTCSMKRQFT